MEIESLKIKWNGADRSTDGITIQEVRINKDRSMYAIKLEGLAESLGAGNYTISWDKNSENSSFSESFTIDPSLRLRKVYAKSTDGKKALKKADNVTGTFGSDNIKKVAPDAIINSVGDRFREVNGEMWFDRTLGLNAVDSITGGKGYTMTLGDVFGSYYAGDGRSGYLNVKKFGQRDKLLLAGKAEDYTIRSLGKKGKVAEILLNDGSGPGDLIAIVKGKAARQLSTPGNSQLQFLAGGSIANPLDLVNKMAAPEVI